MTQPPPRPTKSAGPRSGRERRSRERRVLAIGLGVSFVVHLLAIAFVSGWLELEPTPAPPPPSELVVEPSADLWAVELRVEPEGSAAPSQSERGIGAEPARDRSPTREPQRVRVAEEEAESESDRADAPSDARTAAERLAPRVVDARLWRPMILVPREMTIEDVEARVAAAVELLSDSALAEADAAMRARDWTVEDAEGGKWGISPGKLHLGSLVLPLPIYSVATPQQVESAALWFELDQQLERSLILESFQERVRTIRERRERERSENGRGDNGGG